MDATQAKQICDDASFYEVGKVWKQVFGKTLVKSKMKDAVSTLTKELGTKKLAHSLKAVETEIDLPEEKPELVEEAEENIDEDYFDDSEIDTE
ncbi:MAG TPA: hypothetical protein VMZ04_10025 [Anaerolineae bacterium]|nr:hypothetical protein [Anaerolineae bacterium]